MAQTDQMQVWIRIQQYDRQHFKAMTRWWYIQKGKCVCGLLVKYYWNSQKTNWFFQKNDFIFTQSMYIKSETKKAEV